METCGDKMEHFFMGSGNGTPPPPTKTRRDQSDEPIRDIASKTFFIRASSSIRHMTCFCFLRPDVTQTGCDVLCLSTGNGATE
jgi:hypothetical protein